MKLNKKGFAITAIIYSILVIVIIIMTLVLAIMSSRRQTVEKIQEKVKEETSKKAEIVDSPDLNIYEYSTPGQYDLTLNAGTYELEVWGAQGGYRTNSSYGGKGGYSSGQIKLTKKTDIYVFVGGAGGNGSSGCGSTICAGGFNGGGYRYKYYGGGGASDIRIGTDSLYARVIVAGGGGSDGAKNKNGMYGGGTNGGSANQSYGSYGYGGTQNGNKGGTSYITTTQSTTGGTSKSNVYSGFGFGGMGVYYSSGYGGAGGGGWYGGTGSYPDYSADDDRGGGGGSGYILTNDSLKPTGYLLTSEYYLTNAQLKSGNEKFLSPLGEDETGHIGDGFVRITKIS